MSNVEWETASAIEWEGYYRAVAGRSLRELFVDAPPFLPTAAPDDRLSLPSISAVAMARRRSSC